MAVDPAIVRRRLRRLERCVRVLRELRQLGRSAFVSDEAVQDRVERNAELAAQACADIALHIIAASGRVVPETYAEAVEALASIGIIDSSLAGRVAAAVRLRNILTHGYLDVDHGRLFDEIGWIEDASAFAEQIERWLPSGS